MLEPAMPPPMITTSADFTIPSVYWEIIRAESHMLTRRSLLQASLAVPALARKRPLEEVVVVFKTHFDIGYTDLAREVVARYRTSMIDKALAVIDRSQALPPEHRFVWTVSGWPIIAQARGRRTRL